MKAGELKSPPLRGGLLPSHRGDWGDYPATEGAGGVTPHGSTACDDRQPIGPEVRPRPRAQTRASADAVRGLGLKGNRAVGCGL